MFSRCLCFAGCAALLASSQSARAEESSEPPPVPKLQEAASDAGGTYEKITMTEAVHRALLRNPSAQVAALEIDRANALLGESRSTSLPYLTANGAYTRLDNARRLGTNTLAAENQISANLTLAVPLLAPQRWVQWSQSKANVGATEASNQDARRSVALATARAYLAVVSQKRVVEIKERLVLDVKPQPARPSGASEPPCAVPASVPRRPSTPPVAAPPPEGEITPERSFRVVVLPAPFGPRKATNSPCSTLRSMRMLPGLAISCTA